MAQNSRHKRSQAAASVASRTMFPADGTPQVRALTGCACEVPQDINMPLVSLVVMEPRASPANAPLAGPASRCSAPFCLTLLMERVASMPIRCPPNRL
jgi:hypothetical protein